MTSHTDRPAPVDHDLVDLSNDVVGVVLDVSRGVPTWWWWGAPVDHDRVWAGEGHRIAAQRPVPFGGLDVDVPLAVVPLHGDGSSARPGLLGHRHAGRDWAPRFQRSTVATHREPDGTQVLVHTGVDEVAGLVLITEVQVAAHGMVRLRASLTNDHQRRYMLDALSLSLPVPADACELLTLEGRWAREAHMVRERWRAGSRLIEHRGARPTQTRPPLMWAMTPGTGEWHGQVWAVHLAWAANHTLLAEQAPDGRRHVQAGELLHPGELCLEPGDTYTSPWVLGMWSGEGLTPASWGFHREVRSRAHHPGVDRPRSVIVSTWEAGYFDHDATRLQALADAAAQVGCERFVLDDGWFGSRRDDRRGLGDWVVSTEAHPDGLESLFDAVRARGMSVGLWVEPEMVNPDSDLFRAHPDWVLGTPGYEPVLARHQLVLDLTRSEVREHLFQRLSALIEALGVTWLKWDMNRDHVAASLASGAAGTHHQTLALHALWADLRSRFPELEIESCASGGGRADLATLCHTVRVWASDCNDPVERQRIQRGWSLLLPPEVIGAHIGPPRAHTTGRPTTLAFRAITALFGHLGVEWDLGRATDEERAALAEVIALHRRFRPLLHGGDAVRFDLATPVEGPDDPDTVAQGVYAPDRREALVAWVQLRTSATLVPPRWRLPGLRHQTRYAVRWLPLPGDVRGPAHGLPPWMATDPAEPVVLSGEALATWGLQPPVLWPEQGILVHLEAVGEVLGP